jgi:hypothetical protein
MTSKRLTASCATCDRQPAATHVTSPAGGEHTVSREFAALGAVPCTPIYVYTWRARLGGYLALAAVLLVGVYALIR